MFKNISERKVEDDKDFKDENLEKGMAYYCKLCKCQHYPGSDSHKRHKIHARKKAVKKKKHQKYPNIRGYILGK